MSGLKAPQQTVEDQCYWIHLLVVLMSWLPDAKKIFSVTLEVKLQRFVDLFNLKKNVCVSVTADNYLQIDKTQ